MHSRWSKLLWGVLAVVAGFYVARHVLAVVLVEGQRVDLDIVITAAKRFMAQEPVYRLDDLWEHTKPPLLMGLAYPLAALPHFWIRLFWDLVVLLMPPLILKIGLDLFPLDLRPKWNWRATVLTWSLMYPFWYREAELGQYNLFVFFLILAAARLLQSSRSWAGVVAGALAVFSILIKPSQLYLVPWLVLSVRSLPGQRSRWIRAFAGGSVFVIGLACSYVVLHSLQELVSAHREYLSFLSLSTAKHLWRGDNFGLPALLSRLGWGSLALHGAFLPITLGITAAWSWRFRARPFFSLHFSALLMLAFSPMSWRANFGVLLLVAFALGQEFERNRHRVFALAGLMMILLVSRASEYWFGTELLRLFGVAAGPLWLMAGATGCLEWIRRRASV
jgi:hypothetical protein